MGCADARRPDIHADEGLGTTATCLRPAVGGSWSQLGATLAMWLSVLSIVAAANSQAGTITDERDVPWVSLRDLTNARYVEAFERYRNDYRLIDVDAYPDDGELRYSMIWQRNTDGRRWASRRGMTSSEYHQWWERYRDEGLRPHDVEGYRTTSGLRFAGIWVANSEGLGWSSRRNLTSDEYGDYFRDQRAAGRRPVDLDLYETGAGQRIAAIFYDNPTGTAWAALRGMPRERYQREVDERAASGFRILDFESYRTSSGQRYAAIWERNPAAARLDGAIQPQRPRLRQSLHANTETRAIASSTSSATPPRMATATPGSGSRTRRAFDMRASRSSMTSSRPTAPRTTFPGSRSPSSRTVTSSIGGASAGRTSPGRRPPTAPRSTTPHPSPR